MLKNVIIAFLESIKSFWNNLSKNNWFLWQFFTFYPNKEFAKFTKNCKKMEINPELDRLRPSLALLNGLIKSKTSINRIKLVKSTPLSQNSNQSLFENSKINQPVFQLFMASWSSKSFKSCLNMLIELKLHLKWPQIISKNKTNPEIVDDDLHFPFSPKNTTNIKLYRKMFTRPYTDAEEEIVLAISYQLKLIGFSVPHW